MASKSDQGQKHRSRGKTDISQGEGKFISENNLKPHPATVARDARSSGNSQSYAFGTDTPPGEEPPVFETGPSPIRTIIVVVLAAFIAEFVLMGILHFVPPVGDATEAILYAAVPCTILLPVLLLLVYRPAKKQIARRRAENEAQAEKQALLKSPNVAGVIFVALDTRGRITLINKYGGELLGYSDAELIGRNWFRACLPERVRRQTQSVFKRLMTGDTGPVAYYENPIVTSDGNERIIAWHNAVLKDDSGRVTGTLSKGRDITDQRRSEEALRESEAKYWKLFEQSSDSCLILNGYRFADANKAAVQFLGYEHKKDLIGKTPWDISPPLQPDGKESGDKAKGLIEEARQKGSHRFEWVHLDKYGQDLFVDVSLMHMPEMGEQTFYIVWRDITQRKQAEEQLRTRLNYEQLLSRISSLASQAEDLDAFQNECLRILGEELKVSRVYIFEHNHATDSMDNTLEWTANGVPAQKENLQKVPTGAAPWWMEMVKNGKQICFEDIEHIPDEATKVMLRHQDILSILVVPLFVKGRYYGFMGFDECVRKRSWPQEDIDILNSISHILTATIERKHTQRIAENSQRRFETLLENLPGLAYRCWSKPDWPMEFISAGCKDLTGYAPHDFTRPEGVGLETLIHPDDRRMVWDEVQKVTENDEPFQVEYRIRTRDGKEKWVWEHGVCVGRDKDGTPILEGYIGDITARRRAEHAERELARFSSESPYPVIRIRHDGIILYANNPAMQLLHGKDCNVGGQAPQEWLEPTSTALRLGCIQRQEVCHDERIFTFYYAPVAEENYVNVYGIDITQQKRFQEQMLRAQKMEAVGQLAGGIAHDFRNQLTVIRGFTEMLFRDAGAERRPKVKKDIDEIIKACDRAARLTGQLLAFGRRQVLQPEVVNPADLVRELVKPLRKVIGEDIKLLATPGLSSDDIYIDPGLFQHAILNLALDARDAMPAGGELTIWTGCVELDEEFTGRYENKAPGQYVAISVSDTGVGMDEETLVHIFEPFFTTKEADKGSSLGLSTVYGFVNQSGGIIECLSEKGKGTEFRMYFPCISEEEKAKQARKSRAVGVEPARAVGQPAAGRILLVEDEPSVGRIIHTMLAEAGYEVVQAKGAEEAMRAMKDGRFAPDMLVTDVVIPGQSGMALAREVSAMCPNVSVLYISGYAGDELHRRGLDKIADKILEKPFTGDELLSRVAQMMAVCVRALYRYAQQFAGLNVARCRTSADVRGPRGRDPAVYPLRPAQAELKHRLSLGRTANARRLGSHQRLVVKYVQQSGFDYLALQQGAPHADQRFLGEHQRALGGGRRRPVPGAYF